jgi:hypothetical protein
MCLMARVLFLAKAQMFLYSTEFIPAPRPIQWVLGALTPGVRRLVRETDHSPPYMTEVKNDGAVPPLLLKSTWHITNLIKHRNNFNLAIYRIGFLKLCRLFNLCTTFFLTLITELNSENIRNHSVVVLHHIFT